jgi:hypothetical protein
LVSALSLVAFLRPSRNLFIDTILSIDTRLQSATTSIGPLDNLAEEGTKSLEEGTLALVAAAFDLTEDRRVAVEEALASKGNLPSSQLAADISLEVNRSKMYVLG